MVPLIIKVPGKQPAVCNSFAELVDLYPTISELCGLEVADRLQGKSLVKTLDDPTHKVREAAFCVNKAQKLLRTDKWAYIQYGEGANCDAELFDMKKDPKQYTNLAKKPEYKPILEEFQKQMTAKLSEVRTNDLGIDYSKRLTKSKKKKTKKK